MLYCSPHNGTVHVILFTQNCSSTTGSLPCAVTMPDDTEATAHRARLEAIVKEAEASHLWLTIENQFLDNREQRTLHIDAAFRTFVQGDLSINEY
jgi:hypothetical protein